MLYSLALLILLCIGLSCGHGCCSSIYRGDGDANDDGGNSDYDTNMENAKTNRKDYTNGDSKKDTTNCNLSKSMFPNRKDRMCTNIDLCNSRNNSPNTRMASGICGFLHCKHNHNNHLAHIRCIHNQLRLTKSLIRLEHLQIHSHRLLHGKNELVFCN